MSSAPEKTFHAQLADLLGLADDCSWNDIVRQSNLSDIDVSILLKSSVEAPKEVGRALLCAASHRPLTAAQAASACDVLGRMVPDDNCLRVFVTGNSTLAPFVHGLKLALLNCGYFADVVEGEFDQWAQDMLEERSSLYTTRPSVVALVLSAMGATAGGVRIDNALGDALAMALPIFQKLSSAKLVIILPEPLEEEIDSTSLFSKWRHDLISRVRSLAGSDDIILDPTPALIEIGGKNWYAPRFWHHAKMHCHPNALTAFAWTVRDTVVATIARRIKVVACDFDNTLWGGIVGEVGVNGVRLDAIGEGGGFLHMQAFLKRLKERGILLVALSKNTLEIARQVFEDRPEMHLKWDDFTSVAVNWESKSKNLNSLAAELRLGLEHFCFIDDSAFEREEVRAALPSVYVPQLPDPVDERVGFLVRTGMFQTPVLTDEDMERTRYYAQEAQRASALSAGATMEDFLKSLELEVTPLPIGEDNLKRVEQLVHKTNQFNLTTFRHDLPTLRAFVNDKNTYTFCFRVRDKFGDSGIVGVLIAVPDMSYGPRVIDTFIMSCRVIGRTVEYAMFQHLAEWTRAHDETTLKGTYFPTAKNGPVMDLLENLGGIKLSQTEYSFDLTQPWTGNKFALLQ